MPVITIEDENAIHAELEKASGKLVVIDFTATWCGPCKQITPFFEELSIQYPSTVFLKVDVDDNAEIAMKYEVTAMPTFLFLKRLKELDRVLGADYQGLENRVHSWSSSTSSLIISSVPSNQWTREINPATNQSLNSKPIRDHSRDRDIVSKTSRGQKLSNATSNNNKINTNTHQAILAQSGNLMHASTHQAIEASSNSLRPLPPDPVPASGVHLLPSGYNNKLRYSVMTAQYDSNRSTQMSERRQEGISYNHKGDKDSWDNEGINFNNIYSQSTEEIREEGKPEVRTIKEKKNKSSHRTTSSVRKESHNSSHSNSILTKTNKENENFAQKALKVKKKLPTSVIQIRLADGSKMTAKFNTTHMVSKIREFINNARPANATKPFVLMSNFSSREISNEDQTLVDAKLLNAVIIQRLI